jgi:creatinine amidohydrolase/Fe(II)-dependent formamide hydrolase-like protein
MIRLKATTILIGLTTSFAMADPPNTVFLEELTTTEVRDAINGGTTTIIIPTAGIEQNGPHMVLGKHKYRMNAGAERIARALDNTLVAPVMNYVPEGDIDPPSGHMRYSGTISIPNEVFMSVMEYAARSFKAHGFTDIVLIGDSGGNQAGMEEVTNKLNEEWAEEETRVHHVSEWFFSKSFRNWLVEQGNSEETIGRHAGLLGTSTMLAVAPEHIRRDTMLDREKTDVPGVNGDPTKSTVEIGRKGMDLQFEAAMTQIRELLAEE